MTLILNVLLHICIKVASISNIMINLNDKADYNCDIFEIDTKLCQFYRQNYCEYNPFFNIDKCMHALRCCLYESPIDADEHHKLIGYFHSFSDSSSSSSSENVHPIFPKQPPTQSPTFSEQTTTQSPTFPPTPQPTIHPAFTGKPTTEKPTILPTMNPTNSPTSEPTMDPTNFPTPEPTPKPSKAPTPNLSDGRYKYKYKPYKNPQRWAEWVQSEWPQNHSNITNMIQATRKLMKWRKLSLLSTPWKRILVLLIIVIELLIICGISVILWFGMKIELENNECEDKLPNEIRDFV